MSTPKRPPPLPPVEMPPEIIVDDRGPTDVKFVLPHRQLVRRQRLRLPAKVAARTT